MFRAHRAHTQERQIVSTQPLVTVTLCRWPCLVQVGSELSCVPVGTQDSHPLERIIPDDVLIKFYPPDDEHVLLKMCRGVKKIH